MTVVATFPKLAHDWLKHELDRTLFRRAGTIKSGSGIVKTGLVLGQIAVGTPVSAAKAGGNTGNGTFVLDVTTPALANAVPGVVYTARFTTTTSVRLEADGQVLADIAIGGATGNNVTINERIKAVLTQGATPFAAGDGFDVTIPKGSEKYVPIAPAALDGSQRAAAILINGCDATSADVETAVLTGNAQIVPNQLTWPDGTTTDQKNAALADLAKLGIVSHQR